MKKNSIKIDWLLFVILIITLFFSLFLCFEKSGFHEDEIVTYGLSNSHFASWINDIKEEYIDGDMTNTILTKNDIMSYLCVNPNERFDYQSVYYNQTNDVHPFLYYLLLNTICSFTPMLFTKWSGLILNLALYLLTCAIIYLILKEMYSSRISRVSALLYGLSAIGLSNMLFIRMYILLTLISVLLIYELLLYIKHDKKIYLFITLTIMFGMLTHYNFVFFAFFACLTTLVMLIKNKEYKKATLFSVFAFLGIVLFVLIYPYCFVQIINGANNGTVSGKTTITNLLSISEWPRKILNYIIICAAELKYEIILFIALLIIIVINKAIQKMDIKFELVLVSLTFILTYIITTIVNPDAAIRYFYNLAPLFFIILGMLIDMASRIITKVKINYILIAVVAFCSLFYIYKGMYPDHTKYRNVENEIPIIQKYSNNPCLYVTSEDFKRPRDYILQFLVESNDVYITLNINESKTRDYIKNHNDNNEALVYFSSNIPEENIQLQLNFIEKNYDMNNQKLFNTRGASVYVLKNNH